MTTLTNVEHPPVYVVEAEVEGFALVYPLDGEAFRIDLHANAPAAARAVQVTGRRGLNELYAQTVGYQPDDECAQPLPLIDFAILCASALLFTTFGAKHSR